MNFKPIFLPFALFLIISASVSTATRPSFTTQLKKSTNPGQNDPGFAGGFGPGSGFSIPGFGPVGGGYGGGFGGPKGGSSRSGVIRPTVVCKEKGPCYKKKLTCPAKCFTSYGGSGKGYGGGGGGGGCTIDCKKKCSAYC